MAGWWKRILAANGPSQSMRGPRTSGRPTSSNGASSFHLRWQFGAGVESFESVEVELRVAVAPAVDRLYFWALQADFADATGRRAGGAHLGLQWHPGHPASTAVNWGGYDARGSVLHGSESALASATANPHTRDYPWVAGRAYRLRIERGTTPAPAGLTPWRGVVIDTVTGVGTVVRELFPAGDRLCGVTMWSEVFADCDHPEVAVEWSRAVASTISGSAVQPASFAVNYQAHADGGCANTDSGRVRLDDGCHAIRQRTATARTTPQGAVLPAGH